MVMSVSAVKDVAASLVEKNLGFQRELDDIDRWLVSGNPVEIYQRAHSKLSQEKAELHKLAYTPILELIVSELAQQMIVDQVVIPGDDEAGRRLFTPWDRNGMPSKQYGLWRAAFGYGQAHLLVLPGEAARPGVAGGAVMMPFSPRQLFVSWNDRLEDEFPAYALRLVGETGKWHGLRLYDEEAVHFLTRDTTTGELTYVEAREHGMGVVPVVTFTNDVDLEGRTPGEVSKYKVLAERHNKTTADRLLAQHYNSWKVRWATGIEQDESPAEAAQQKVKLAQDDVLVGGDGVAFGTLPETSLDGLLKAAEADRDAIAAVSQTPVWALNGGQLINLSAEALIEARSMQKLKVGQKQRSNGVAVARALRLAAFAEGRWEDADRFDLQVRWVDVEARSLGAVADGLQKLNAMGIPPELLVELIPGLSSARVAQWREHMQSSGAGRLAAVLERQLDGGNE
ncbi:phage portal protein [Trueperella pyogenes]|uniref:phage portal protein n=2 Tax=Trueperella pyogenes TaxID=1661 RepID=UPI00345DD6F4